MQCVNVRVKRHSMSKSNLIIIIIIINLIMLMTNYNNIMNCLLYIIIKMFKHANVTCTFQP